MKWFLFVSVGAVVISAVSGNSNASESGISIKNIESKTSYRKSSLSPFSWDNYDANFKLKQNSFTSSNKNGFRSDFDSQFSQLGVGIKGTNKWRNKWFSSVDGEWFYSAQEQNNYVNLKNLYAEKNWGQHKFSIGRKDYNWSSVDRYWGLGLWQPRFEWSKLRSQQNGLMGLFWEKPYGENVKVTAFASGFFIPDLGPRFDIEEGEFQVSNPWFIPPAQMVTIPGLTTNDPIYYTLDTPRNEDVFFRESVALQLQLGSKVNQWSLSAASKPISQALLAIDARYQTTPKVTPLVTVDPRFGRHTIASLENRWNLSKDLSWVNGFSQEFPEEINEKDEPTRIYSRYKESTHISSMLSYGQTTPLGTRLREWRLAYYKKWGGEELDGGPLASDEKSLFESRFRLYEAFRIGLTQSLPWTQKPLSLSADFTLDTEQNAWTLTSDLNYQWSSSWNGFVQLDHLALIEKEDEGQEGRFVDLYKSNDQLSLGVNYVF